MCLLVVVDTECVCLVSVYSRLKCTFAGICCWCLCVLVGSCPVNASYHLITVYFLFFLGSSLLLPLRGNLVMSVSLCITQAVTLIFSPFSPFSANNIIAICCSQLSSCCCSANLVCSDVFPHYIHHQFGFPPLKARAEPGWFFPFFFAKTFYWHCQWLSKWAPASSSLLPKLSVQISGRLAKVKGKKVWAVKFQLPLPLNHFSMYHSSVNFF